MKETTNKHGMKLVYSSNNKESPTKANHPSRFKMNQEVYAVYSGVVYHDEITEIQKTGNFHFYRIGDTKDIVFEGDDIFIKKENAIKAAKEFLNGELAEANKMIESMKKSRNNLLELIADLELL